MLTHYNMVANSCQFSRFDPQLISWDMDSQLGVLPFFHVYVSRIQFERSWKQPADSYLRASASSSMSLSLQASNASSWPSLTSPKPAS